ncbi:glycosyltransferase family 4 protein [Nonomuraea sp. NPDC049152]|uniref:glycosyltransferase family 4 protein n=1 Tax=Nonomuraea sp. NPDC049152 TaxID=3154350 RepID=UPI00340C1B09
MTRVLVVTNDFPPRPGGIQSFVHGLALRTPSVLVYASRWRGCEEFDRRQPYPVVRHPTSLMLPTVAVARRAARLVAAHRADTVVFGAAAPLGLLAPSLRAAGARRIVMLTHGHESSPLFRPLMRRIGAHADVVTYLGSYTHARLAGVVPPAKLVRLTPGVDPSLFHPSVDAADLRRSLGLDSRPVAVCVSRLVPRKGQDQLIRAWPLVLRAVPSAVLLIVGGGPDRRRLARMAAPLGESVRFTGVVPPSLLPSYYAVGDVFAMPCRTRLGGIDVEGLGIVFLEASATGLPVVAGASGGAPDAVRHGETGLVVDGRSVDEVAGALIDLLGDPERARKMGERGREWVSSEWDWQHVASRFRTLL